MDASSATKNTVDSTRTSSQTWLYEARVSGALEFLVPLTIKMELMSGLRILAPNCSEAYQVASYGPSHHYKAHIDSFEDPRRSRLYGIAIHGQLPVQFIIEMRS